MKENMRKLIVLAAAFAFALAFTNLSYAQGLTSDEEIIYDDYIEEIIASMDASVYNKDEGIVDNAHDQTVSLLASGYGLTKEGMEAILNKASTKPISESETQLLNDVFSLEEGYYNEDGSTPSIEEERRKMEGIAARHGYTYHDLYEIIFRYGKQLEREESNNE